MNSYLKQTSTLTYSFLICLPLFVIYEALILISQPETDAVIRLSADIWIRQILFYFHDNTLLLSFIILVVLGGVIFYRERKKEISYHPRFFGLMIAESVVWAVLLAFLVSGFTGMLFSLTASSGGLEGAGITRLQMLALSIGAGLYEELVFRVIIVYALLWLFKLFVEEKPAVILAVLLAAVLFSAVHYTGSLGDTFTWPSFVFRMLFGLALNALLLIRGFGITAWTHSMYDVLLVLFLWK